MSIEDELRLQRVRIELDDSLAHVDALREAAVSPDVISRMMDKVDDLADEVNRLEEELWVT